MRARARKQHPAPQRDYLRVPHRVLAGAVEDALLHYCIGHQTAGAGLYVAWDYVAQKMAEALEGATDEREVRRAGA